MNLSNTVLKVDSDDIIFRSMKMIQKWCVMPYPGHPDGCPKSFLCDFYRPDLENRIKGFSYVHLIIVHFNLDMQAWRMKRKHPEWTEKQCRNLLYWQGSVRAEIKRIAKEKFSNAELIIGAEGGGVDFYLTMRRLGFPLDSMRDLHIVQVIGIVLEDETRTRKLAEWA